MNNYFDALLGSMVNTDGSNTEDLDGVKVGVSTFGNKLKTFTSPTTDRDTILAGMDRAFRVRQLGTYTHYIFEDLIARKHELVATGEIGKNGAGLNVVIISDGLPFVFWNKNQMKHQLRKCGINPQGKMTRKLAARALFSYYIEKFTQLFPRANIYGVSPQPVVEEFMLERFNTFYLPSNTDSIEDWSLSVKLDSCNTDTPIGFDIVCYVQDFYLYQDVSQSMSKTLKTQMLGLFNQLMFTWFDQNGGLRSSIDIRLALNSFAKDLVEESPIDANISKSGNDIINKFVDIQSKSEFGTHSFQIFRDLVQRRNALIATGRIDENGKGLNVIIATDGDPFLAASEAERAALFAEAGNLTIPIPTNQKSTGLALHFYWYDQFKLIFPESLVFGFAPFALDTVFMDNTFDLFYYPDIGFTIEEWSKNITETACPQVPNI